jgi:Leucine-rich repeat (LRR) protein
MTLVDLSDNDIGILDKRISQYISLAVFRVKRCNLKAFPFETLETLEHLTVLDLASNQLTDFCIGRLTKSIRELDLSSNKLRTFVGSDVELPNLVKLNVSHNDLEELPAGLICPRLQGFDCGHNSMSEVPQSFLECALHSLTTLEARHNRIIVSPDLTKFAQLRIVDLSENRLTKVPAVNVSLTRLTLSSNQIRSLDGLFDGQCTYSELVELHIRDNRLSKLDSAVMQPVLHVKVLDLRNNDLSVLPAVLGYLPHVRKLLLNGNPIRNLGDHHDTKALQLRLRKRAEPPPGNGYLPQETDEMVESLNPQMTSAAVSSIKRGL